MNASKEFKVGNHNIGWINDRFSDHFKDSEFEMRPVPSFQKLPQSMNDATIESTLKPGMCELGDILAFLDGAPEECKDGNWNLFYTPAFVVRVLWYSSVRDWHVDTWERDGNEWDGSDRVFSPATGTKKLDSGSSDTLPLELIINGITYRKV